MVGLDAPYNAGQTLRGDESNQLDKLAGYALVSLRTSYAVSRRWELFARVSNLFDTNYAIFGLLGESPDEVLPALTDQRPIFVGAGAPRAAWVGVRLRL